MSTPAQSTLNPRAQSGFANASHYDKYRPTYPEDAVSRLLTVLHVADVPSATIIDLAAGTGKFTELLAKRSENYNIIAVEPHDGMREELEAKKLQNVKVVKGWAERMQEIKNESVDGVIASQSFHWFATLDALEEIYRVIKPGGVFGMIWNIEDYNAPKKWETSGYEQKMKELTWQFDDGVPRFRHEKWKQVFDDQLGGNPLSILKATDPMFGLPIGEEKFPFETWLSKEDVWNRYFSLSQISVLKGEDLDVSTKYPPKFSRDSADLLNGAPTNATPQRVKKAVSEALNGDDVKPNAEGKVAIHGNTVVAYTTKIPGRPLREWG